LAFVRGFGGLLSIGEWIKKNHQGIYLTRRSRQEPVIRHKGNRQKGNVEFPFSLIFLSAFWGVSWQGGFENTTKQMPYSRYRYV
jgi:hypothetical protein